jgi:cation diffusion facilitator CzcD-associated flavoprotein CzcO
VNFEGKRVAVIGTGAIGLQTIPIVDVCPGSVPAERTA